MADAVDRGGFEALDPCVHCGFCLPACPTYLATADEADSPRGRIVLMRALERGELGADDPAVIQHLDACLGCRGCQPACPSGVGYGRGLEAARVRLVAANGLPASARFLLGGFARSWVSRPALAVARWFRATGAAGRFAGPGRLGFMAGMLDATKPREAARESRGATEPAPARGSVALFRGCVMDGLFAHVHAATRRTLEANGYRVIEVAGQACCGALHEHAGDRAGAVGLARRNLAALAGTADWIVVNSAGCGALLKSYDHLVADTGDWASRVRDVVELLAAVGPRAGAPLALDVVYDAPCHLQHAQGVQAEALAVFRAVPGLALRLLADSDRCCGAAGLYGVLHPELSRAVLAAKIESIGGAEPRPGLVATGNPGCLMQIGAGLKAAGLPIGVAHPVEVLDWSYRAAGYYD